MKLTDEAAALIAAQYALGGLTRRVRLAVERRAASDARFAQELRRWQELVLDLTASTASTELPVRVWQRIQGQLPVAPQPASAPARARPWWQRLWVWQSWVAAAAALALAVGVLPALQRTPLRAPLRAPVAPPSITTAQALPATPRPVLPVTVQPTVPEAVAPVPRSERSAGLGRESGTAAPVAGATAKSEAAPRIAAAEGAASADASPPHAAAPTATAVATNSALAAAPATALQDASPPERHQARMLATRGIGGADSRATTTVSVLESRQGARAWRVHLDAARGELHVQVLARQDPGAAHEFELWAIPDDGGAPRAIGLIAGDKDVVLPLDSRLQRSVRMAQALAVSIEPAGGSPADGPTGPVSYTGRVEKI